MCVTFASLALLVIRVIATALHLPLTRNYLGTWPLKIKALSPESNRLATGITPALFLNPFACPPFHAAESDGILPCSPLTI